MVSDEIDFVSRSPPTSRSSIPRESWWKTSPRTPKRRTSQGRERSASCPAVSTPAARSCAAVRGPIPQIASTGSGARNSASRPGGTTVSPSGLSTSDAIFATDFPVATPHETVSSVSSRTRRLIQAASSRPSAPSATRCETSTNASSSESGSISGEAARSTSMITPDTRR